MLAGNDYYPDIIVGRFSAATAEQVATQVNKTIYYEKAMPFSPWLKNAAGIAFISDHGGGHGSGCNHLREIRADLLNAGWINVLELYDGSQGGADAPENPTRDMVHSVLNKGVAFVNYIGHGQTGGWYTSWFSVADVDNLKNDLKLPFIFSVACYVGSLGYERANFAEAWLRAKNPNTGNGTGAVAFYGGANVQSTPAITAQDEFADLLTTNVTQSFGGLCIQSACKMIKDYGDAGYNNFIAWNIFGDPSLNIYKNPNIVPVLYPLILE